MGASLIGHSDRCSDRKRCRAEQETVPRPIVPDDFANDMGGSSRQVFGVAREVRNSILRNVTRLGRPIAQNSGASWIASLTKAPQHPRRAFFAATSLPRILFLCGKKIKAEPFSVGVPNRTLPKRLRLKS
jgi:hypothetical protein